MEIYINGERYYQPHIFNNGLDANSTVYSDRLYQWDYEKYNELCWKYFGNHGQYWSGRDTKLIEAFLRDYIDDQTIVLCRIEETVNQSSGYPLWRFDYLKDK